MTDARSSARKLAALLDEMDASEQPTLAQLSDVQECIDEVRDAVRKICASPEHTEEARIELTVACPACGCSSFRHVETLNCYHVAYTKGNMLVIEDSDGDVDWDGNNDGQLVCDRCGHWYPIPSVPVEYI